MTQFKGKTRQEVFNEGHDRGYYAGFKEGYKKKVVEALESVAAVIEKAHEDGIQRGWDARNDTEKMIAEEIDKEFYKFWNGEKNYEGAERVYSYVDPGTARALFAEGWSRAEEREQQQKKETV